MRDDDELGSGSGLLWYEVGRSSGYSSGESDGLRQGESRGYDQGWSDAVRQMNARQENDRRNGIRAIHIKDYNSWVDLVNERGQQIADLQSEVRDLEKQLENSRDSTSRERDGRDRQERFRTQIVRCLHSLLKAAERGKTDRPEYAELRGILQQLFDAVPLKNSVDTLLDAVELRIIQLDDALHGTSNSRI